MRRLCGEMGVREYFLFKPDYGTTGRSGVMRAYYLMENRLVEIGARGMVGGEEEYESEALGLGLRAEGNRVRLRDLATGRDLELPHEIEQARRAAEARIAELEALLNGS